MAANQLADRIGAESLPSVNAMIKKQDVSPAQYVHGLWVLQRLNALQDDAIKTALVHKEPVVRVHALRTIAEQKDTSAVLYPEIVKALNDNNPHVRRAAVEVMGRYVNMSSVESLVDFRKKIRDEDSHMIYTTK
jgi:hypothetical protein